MTNELNIWQFIQALSAAPELTVGVIAIVSTLFTVELVKPWLKLAIAGRGWSASAQDATLRSLVYLVAIPVTFLLDFHANFSSLLDGRLEWSPSMFAAIPIGTILTGGLTQITYHLLHRLQVVKTLQLRWQRFNGITQNELDAVRHEQDLKNE